MVVKEFIEARWKAIIGIVVAAAAAAALAGTYNLIASALATGNATRGIPPQFQSQIQQLIGSYESYAWSQWFSKTGPEVLAILERRLDGKPYLKRFDVVSSTFQRVALFQPPEGEHRMDIGPSPLGHGSRELAALGESSSICP